MSDSPENEAFLPRDQTPLRTKHTAGRRFQQNFTPPLPPHFTPTPGTGAPAQPEGTPMTYDQYLDLKNDYRAMLEELRKHNEHGASQQGPTATRQRPQMPNAKPEPSDSNEAQASSGSWKPHHSSIERSNGASGSSSAKSRRRESKAYQSDHAIRAELENVMQELQQLKKVRLG